MKKYLHSSERSAGPRLITGTALLIVFFLLAFVGASVADPVAIPNFHKVTDGIYRGARPRKAGVQELKALGIKTIVNLESNRYFEETDDARDERQWAKEAGIAYFYQPMSPVTAPTTEAIDAAVKQIIDPLNQPVFVHCYRGSDRTGMVIAAYRITIEGWTVKKAYDEMKQYGHAYKIYYNWKDGLDVFAERAKKPVAAK